MQQRPGLMLAQKKKRKNEPCPLPPSQARVQADIREGQLEKGGTRNGLQHVGEGGLPC